MTIVDINLHALAQYERHLAETAPCALEAFHRLGFFDQCDFAAQWAAGRDYVADHRALARDDELVGSNT